MFNGKKGMVLLCLIVFFTVILTALNCPDWRGHLIVENRYNYDICLIIYEDGESREVKIDAGGKFKFAKKTIKFEGISVQRCDDRALYHFTEEADDVTKLLVTHLDSIETTIIIDDENGYWEEP